jgi:hypothetical protein
MSLTENTKTALDESRIAECAADERREERADIDRSWAGIMGSPPPASA